MRKFSEDQLLYNSRYYCPACTGGGDLFVKDTKAYFNHEEPLDYYCKRCKRTFTIDEPRPHTYISTSQEEEF